MPLLPAHPSGASEVASIVAPDEPAAPSLVAPADASDVMVVPDSTSELQLYTAVENRPTTIAATRTSDPFITFTSRLCGDRYRTGHLVLTILGAFWSLAHRRRLHPVPLR